jgi:hypothetical protein
MDLASFVARPARLSFAPFPVAARYGGIIWWNEK